MTIRPDNSIIKIQQLYLKKLQIKTKINSGKLRKEIGLWQYRRLKIILKSFTFAFGIQPKCAIFVDFWAPWCGYCRRLSPAIERMSEEHGETVKMVKLDIDEEPELAEKYDIDTIPSLLLFRDGELVSSVVNPGSQDAVEDWLRENGAL